MDGVDEPIFFQHRDGPILPTLKFVHKYPEVKFTSVTVDKGAIPFVLGGANIMCPGLTNVGEFCMITITYFDFLISYVETNYPLQFLKGGEMPPDTEEGPALDKGDGVVIYAEGKQYPLAVGFMTMSSSDVRKKNKGTGIENCHYLGDGLWGTDEIH